MSARYHVLASDDLMATDGLMWPACLRPIEQEPTDPEKHPGMHWWLMEDDDADPYWEGKRIELTLEAVYDDDGHMTGSRITNRKVQP